MPPNDFPQQPSGQAHRVARVIAPVIAIVGRPNVGKSTLFNALTRSRDALVADEPGVTRDRLAGIGRVGERPFIVFDTGGLGDEPDAMSRQVYAQAMRAAEEASVVVALVDGRAGRNSADEQIAGRLRRAGRPVLLAVNKTEHLALDVAVSDFHALGLGEPVAIAAAHRRGLSRLVERALDLVDPDSLPGSPLLRDETGHEHADGITRVAIVGRPNVGKSTLVNRLAGEPRMVAHDAPGTTRDAVAVRISRRGRDYVLIDTAGVRRRARVSGGLEKLSVIKALQSVSAADVVVLMLDADAGVTEQDMTLLGSVLDAGSALTIAVNKWDALDASDRRRLRDDLERRLSFARHARVTPISALEGSGLGTLFRAVDTAWKSATVKLNSNALTRMLQGAVEANPPPLVRGRRIKLRYAHQGGGAPPIVVVHGNQTGAVPESYRRYLVNYYRREMNLEGTPLRVEFRTGENPFKGRRNKLTPRQERKRKRLLRRRR